MWRPALLLMTACMVTGCVTGPSRSDDVGKRATAIDPATAKPLYWLDKPATAKATATDYDRLWAACDAAARRYRFIPDLLNYRQGIMTSKPLISRGAGEFWRNDVLDRDDLAHSTLATYRRTIRYEITKTPDEHYEVAVKVLVERSTQFERRVTTGIQFKDSFGMYPTGMEFRSDDGVEQAAQYWYATGRDTTLEEALAERIREKVSAK
jgi:hypothetical protein